ncbi:MAG: DegT/DnrJ/EryC1/StrS family aminotransferase [Nitrospirae bacterium]|nr:DegT/DnrJ/EryC1/StrS family aminotransferase [Nitrospirota bacterium]
MIYFKKPIYVTRPLLPDLTKYVVKLEEIWNEKYLTNNGNQHKLLEKELKRHLNVPYLSLFNNGTIALMIAVQSLRLAGEVITTPFTFPATPHVLAWNGIKPVFCDIDITTLNINADIIESMITPQTTAILGVHVFGNPCDVHKIQEIANRYGLRVIYDAAHAFGMKINNRGIGTYGDISMFSFHATKLFHTAEGGALAYNDVYLKDRIDYLKNFGIKNEEEVVMPGINGKMNELQAALGLSVLEYVEDEISKRTVLFDTYKRLLSEVEGITICSNMSCYPDEIVHSYQYLVIKIDKELFGCTRDYVYAQLRNNNVFTRKYFYPLCSDYPCYKHIITASASNLPIANTIVKEVLCLPFYGDLTINDVEVICNMIRSYRNSGFSK